MYWAAVLDDRDENLPVHLAHRLRLLGERGKGRESECVSGQWPACADPLPDNSYVAC